MNDMIANAWNRMSEKQPLRPDEIHGLVELVHRELITAALGEEPNDQEDVALPHGITVRQPFEELDGNDVHSNFTITFGGELIVIAAQVTDGSLGINTRTRHWTPADGPQREWVLTSLRSQVSQVLSEIK